VTFGVAAFRLVTAGAPVDPAGDVYDDFAPGMFAALNDAERVARPAFESMRAGAAAPVPGFKLPADRPGGVAVSGGYEEAIVDTEPTTQVRSATPATVAGGPPAAYMMALSQGGAAAHAATRAAGAGEFTGPDLAVAVRPERYRVADAGTLTADDTGPTSAAEAHDTMAGRGGAAAPAVVALGHEVG
jgi:hypothetical protein